MRKLTSFGRRPRKEAAITVGDRRGAGSRRLGRVTAERPNDWISYFLVRSHGIGPRLAVAKDVPSHRTFF